MNKKYFLKLFCILTTVCILMPAVIFTNEQAKGEEESTSDYIYTWREAESWDYSYDNNSSANWQIIDWESGTFPASNEQFTNQSDDGLICGDYAIWDFNIYKPGNYKIFVRGWKGSDQSSGVSMYWNDTFVDNLNWYQLIGSDWNWYDYTDSSTIYLSNGTGRLKIQSNETGKVEIDKILITNNLSYSPSGIGDDVGSIEHKIGERNSIDSYISFSPLNWEYINSTIYNLSNVINIVDWSLEYDIPKGRAWGSIGEHYAAQYIIKLNYDNLSLFTYLEPIKYYPNEKIDDEIVIKSRKLMINNNDVDCYIAPNWTQPYDHNYSYDNLSIKRRIGGIHTLNETFDITFRQFIENKSMEIYNETFCSESRVNTSSNTSYMVIWNLTKEKYEDYYNFSFEDLDVNLSSTWPTFFGDSYIPICTSGNCITIEEDPFNNPNHTDTLSDFLTKIFGFGFWKLFKYGALTWFLYMFKDKVEAMMLYDFNDHTYDMLNSGNFFHNNFPFLPNVKGNSLPIIYINGTIGKEIDDDVSSYNATFWINQFENQSLESYNVIGTIYGIDPSKTIIVSSLYDSWWCQGTADAAIGMGIVMGIAKYYYDNNIVPKYNIKFIAFGGEEHGFLGGYSYESRHENEDIIAVIDLNQLGFEEHTDTRLTFNVFTNSEELNSTISNITNRSNYVNRTYNHSDFKLLTNSGGGPSNDRPFAENRDEIDTICFLKDSGWTYHHRAGRKNGTGDLFTEGDAFEYANKTYIEVVADMVLNVTKYYTAHSYNTTIGYKWNFVSTPFNEPAYKTTDIYVKHSGNIYTWDEAVDNNFVLDFIYGWNQINQNYESTDILKPGFVYWIYAHTDCELITYGNLQNHNPITTLRNKWNMIGIPGDIPIDITDLIVINNSVEYNWTEATSEPNQILVPVIFNFNQTNQIYVETDQLLPGESYWMFAYYDNCTLLYNLSGGEEQSGGKEGKNIWSAMLEFEEEEESQTNAYVGDAEDASNCPPSDAYDVPLPPAPNMPYLQAWFNDSLLYPYDMLMKDYRNISEKETFWELSIIWISSSPNETTVNITWYPEVFAASGYECWTLIDEENKVELDMIENSCYNYTTEAYELKILNIVCTK
jgi:hypothetical protein